MICFYRNIYRCTQVFKNLPCIKNPKHFCNESLSINKTCTRKSDIIEASELWQGKDKIKVFFKTYELIAFSKLLTFLRITQVILRSPPCSVTRMFLSYITTTSPYNTTEILFLPQLNYSFSASSVLLDKGKVFSAPQSCWEVWCISAEELLEQP